MKVEFESNVAVGHISRLNCWCEEKNIDPTCSSYETSCDVFNRSGSRRANP